MHFFEVLNIKAGSIVSFVGGGGKTTTMFAIAKEAKAKGLKTVITTTTKMYYPKEQSCEVILTANCLDLVREIQEKLHVTNEVIVATRVSEENKLIGLDKSTISMLFEGGADIILCEADGSAGKPLKGAANHEPVIPSECNIIIHVIGIDCMNKPISSEYVHRPEIVANLADIPIGTPITDEIIAKVVTHQKGYQKTSDFIPFINKVYSKAQLQAAHQIAFCIIKRLACKVIIGAAFNEDPIIDVIYNKPE